MNGGSIERGLIVTHFDITKWFAHSEEGNNCPDILLYGQCRQRVMQQDTNTPSKS
jgi:hypothetical protein